MKITVLATAVSLAGIAIAAPPRGIEHHKPGRPGGTRPAGHGSDHAEWKLKKFTSLVAFGDSYTDDSRLGYFIANNGSAPPVGWVNPANFKSASGGRPWPQYVAQYAGVNVYNYAVSGAVCSNDVTPRYFEAIDAPFPAVEQYEVPAYIADSHYVDDNGTKFMVNPPEETVHSIFIGTNDLGNDAFITDSQVAGKNIVDYTECVFRAIESVYNNGARYFVLQNVAPLNLLPQYGLPDKGGLATTQYWADKSGNLTEVSYKMYEYVSLVNDVFKYQTPYLAKITKRIPGAHIAVMDINGLLTDVYNNPSVYLNGTAPPNVTGYANLNGTVDASPDSFLWYDELHPSEQSDRIIAREFVNVVEGTSKWATYWSA